MSTIALCSITAMDRSLADAVALAARCGADGLELTARSPHLDPSANLDEVRAAGECVGASGLELTAFGSYLSYGGDGFEQQVRREVARSEALGTTRLRVWAGHAQGATESNQSDVVRLLQTAGDVAADAGIDVVVERHAGTFADTIERVETLLDLVERENVVLNYQVLDGLPCDQAGAQSDDARRLIPRSGYFHVKNYREDPTGPSAPMQLGGDLEHGVLDYRAILTAAVEAGYRGPYGIEFLAFDERPLEEKLAAGIAWLRRLLEEVGAP